MTRSHTPWQAAQRSGSGLWCHPLRLSAPSSGARVRVPAALARGICVVLATTHRPSLQLRSAGACFSGLPVAKRPKGASEGDGPHPHRSCVGQGSPLDSIEPENRQRVHSHVQCSSSSFSKVAAMGLDPHKHLGRSITSLEPLLLRLVCLDIQREERERTEGKAKAKAQASRLISALSRVTTSAAIHAVKEVSMRLSLWTVLSSIRGSCCTLSTPLFVEFFWN